MKRVLAGLAALTAALLIQLTIVNGLRLPGGGVPDLVLLCVVALGMTGGAGWGVVAGFCAGLALDLAPPADQLVGQYALVLCLAGYAAGRLRVTLRYSALAALAAASAVAVAAEVLAAVVTLALDTPEATGATVARLLPPTLAYDLVVMPVVLIVTVRAAVALGVSLDPLDDSPALETGGSAAPATVAGGLRSRTRVRPHQSGQRIAIGGDRRAAASGRWLVGDVAEAAPTVGAIGWLNGPVRTRRARKDQARLTATLTGASPRKGAFWVGARPQGLTPVTPPPSGPAGLARLRPGAGVGGSASPGARPGPVAAGRPVRLGLAGEQRRRSKAAAQARRAVRGTGLGTGGLDHGLDRHGVGGPGLPSIAFGTGSLPATGASSRRKVPRIAFGTASRPPTGASTRRKVPGIAFGTGSLPGSGASSRRKAHRIAFGSSGGVTSGHGGTQGASARRPKQPHFARASVPRTARPRRAKTASFTAGRRGYWLLPWLHRAGGRSTVWRIASSRTAGAPMSFRMETHR